VATLTTPIAIVLGFGIFGTLIGLGVYFGLRESGPGRGPSAAEPVPTVTVGTTGAVGVEPSMTGAPPANAFRAPPGDSVSASSPQADEARSAIDAQHAHLLEACWQPSVARKSFPAYVTITASLTYDADGNLVIHSVQQDMTSARPDVTMCVTKELVMPKVRMPGRTHISVPIQLP
jgi:hypothetical protein